MDNEELKDIFKVLSFYDELKEEIAKSNVGNYRDMQSHLDNNTPYWWIAADIAWGSTFRGSAYWEKVDDKWSAFTKDGNYEHIREFLSDGTLEIIRKPLVRKPKAIKLDFSL